MNNRARQPPWAVRASALARSPARAGRWARRRLFGNWVDSLLTLVCLWLIYWIGAHLLSWGVLEAGFGTEPQACRGIRGACWAFIEDMWQLFLVGMYPREERYRAYLAFAIACGLTLATLFPRVRRWRPLYLLWAVSPLAIYLILRGSETLGLVRVDTSRWGGLLLTLVLAAGGIVLACPVGIVLALGRRSRMPLVRALCVTYIETIRGVPLITVLFMSTVMLPLFFRGGTEIDKVLRAQIGILLFAAAYLAEVVRGGLQGVAEGQEEAATALGMNYAQRMVLVVLPQALRMVIPPLVSTFIGLLKDTSLVAIIGLLDLLGIAEAATANPRWLGRIVEAYVFAAALYWVLCFFISRVSLRLEKKYRFGGA